MRFLFRTLLFIVGPAGPWIFVGSLTVAMGVWLSPSFNSTTSPQQDIPNENLRIELNGRKRDAGEGDLVITFHNSSSVPFLWPHEGTSFLELEGEEEAIAEAMQLLGARRDEQILLSYLALQAERCSHEGRPFEDLVFDPIVG